MAIHDKPVLRLVERKVHLHEVRLEPEPDAARRERPRSWTERLADRERRRAGAGITPPDWPPLAA